MTESNLDSAVTAGQLRRAAGALGLSESAYKRAVALAGLSPDARAWTRGADRLLLAFGVMAVLAGITAFFAYNWAGLHKFAKFGLIEGGIVAAVAMTAWRGIDSAAGRGALFAAADEAYAPSSAKLELRAAATAVIGHHDQDGVANFLRERFGLDGS